MITVPNPDLSLGDTIYIIQESASRIDEYQVVGMVYHGTENKFSYTLQGENLYRNNYSGAYFLSIEEAEFHFRTSLESKYQEALESIQRSVDDLKTKKEKEKEPEPTN